MVAVEKIEELGAVANFWRARITALRAELGLLRDRKGNRRTDGARYTADRLLREIKKKAADTAEAERSLRMVENELVSTPEVASHRMRESVLPAEVAHSAH